MTKRTTVLLHVSWLRTMTCHVWIPWLSWPRLHQNKKLSKIFPLKRCSQKTFKMHFGSTQKISSQQLPVGCQVKTVANFCSSCAPSRFLRSGFDEGLPEGGKFGPTISGPCCAGTWWLGKFIFVLFFEMYIYIYTAYIYIYVFISMYHTIYTICFN